MRERASDTRGSSILRRTLEVLLRVEKKWLIVEVYEADEKVRAEPFDAFELDLSILWADVVLKA